MLKNEGFGVLYRGIIPPIMVEAPKRAIKVGLLFKLHCSIPKFTCSALLLVQSNKLPFSLEQTNITQVYTRPISI